MLSTLKSSFHYLLNIKNDRVLFMILNVFSLKISFFISIKTFTISFVFAFNLSFIFKNSLIFLINIIIIVFVSFLSINVIIFLFFIDTFMIIIIEFFIKYDMYINYAAQRGGVPRRGNGVRRG